MAYRLTLEADEDYFAIFRRGVEQFGVAQAERYADDLDRTFAFLADFPRAARERTELNPPVRAYPVQAHLVVYRLEDGDIVVLRIRHSREDWKSDHY